MKVKAPKKEFVIVQPMIDSNVIEINIDDIDMGDNYRTIFNKVKLQELADNILLNGVLQAILVRPLPNGKYQRVFGARRIKASILANQTTIIACVKIMTDEQVRDAQFAENLQREDTSPLEDAFAFQNWLSKGLDIPEISARLGKSTSYVAGRLSLNNLIEPLQEYLENETLPLTQAIYLSRLSSEKQEQLIENSLNYNYPVIGDFKQLKEFFKNNIDVSLDSANFPLDLENIVPDTISCNRCPKNTSCSLLLFDEVKSPTCLDQACFDLKTYAWQFDYIKALPVDIYLVRGSYESDDDLWLVDELNDIDTIINDEELIQKEVKMPILDLFLPDKTKYENDESFSKALDSYYERLSQYHEKVKIFNDNVEAGIFLEGYYITGRNRFKKFNFIRSLLEKSNDIQANEKDSTPSIDNIVDQISTLTKKISRGLELDAEKIQCKKVTRLKQIDAYKQDNYLQELPLNEAENNALVYYLFRQMNYEVIHKFRNHFNIQYKDGDAANIFYDQIINLPVSAKNFIVRQVLNHNILKLHDWTIPITEISKSYAEQIHLDLILKEQEEIKIKRENRLNERIALLEKQLKVEKKKVSDQKKLDKAEIIEQGISI